MLHSGKAYQIRQISNDRAIIDDGQTCYLLHSPTLRIFRIDDRTRDIIETGAALKAQYTAAQREETLARLDLSGLFKGEDAKILSEKNHEYYYAEPSVKSLMLNVSLLCNLKCSYCFNDQTSPQKRIETPLMTAEVALKAVDLYLEDEGSENSQESIDFFGGEPLINFDVIREVILYAAGKTKNRKRRLSFNITTNGVLLTEEKYEFLKKYNTRFHLSLDGDEEIHDKNRRTKDGNGTYRRIINNLKNCISERPELFSAHATITPSCLDLVRIDNHFDSLGLENYGFELMYCGCKSSAKPWNKTLVEEYDRCYGIYGKKLLEYILSGEKKRRSLTSILKRLRRIAKRDLTYIPCRMAREAYTIAPDGYVYPCHWLVENKNFRMGSVYRGIDQSRRKKFYPKLVFEKEICKSCWARYLCGGGCPAVSMVNNGNDTYPDKWVCKDRLTMWKWMVWLYLKLNEQNAAKKLL
ncbi:MAG: radical SAM protein [Spirochaetota bacterium]